MAEVIKNAWKNNLWLKILTLASIIMFFCGLFLPPIGSIDNSVIIAVGELLAFGALWQLNKSIEQGFNTKVKIKEIEMQVSKDQLPASDVEQEA